MSFADFINSCKSYEDFKNKASKLPSKGNWQKSRNGKDVSFEFLTKLILLTHPYFKKLNIIKVWHESEIPTREKIKINYPTNIGDDGIDLLIKTKASKFISVQCKFRSDTKDTLRMSGEGGLSTFFNLSNSTCKNIEKNFIFASVYNLPKKKHLIPEKAVFFLENFFSQLDSNKYEGWVNLKNFIKGKKQVYQKKKRLPFQKKAIHNLKKHFLKNSRGSLFLPCGTGKTLISYWFANDINSKKIIILVPNLSLISQVLKTWVEEGIANNNLLKWIVICSDKDVKIKNDPFTTSTLDLPFESTTNEKTIKDFIIKNKSNFFIISTYNSSHKISKISKELKFKFDLCIFDEAHRTVGTKDKLFSKLLYEKNITIKKRLFMTATKREVKNFKDIVDMSNLDIYGDVAHEISFKSAIESKNPILCNYQFIALGVSKNEILDLWKMNPQVRDSSEPDSTTMRYLCSLLLMFKVIKKHKLKKGITFHNTISGSENFKSIASTYQKYINKNNDFVFFNISSSKSSTGNKNQTLKDFEEDKKSIITNARCLVEGVDVPAVDLVLFADRKKSKVDIVQAIGRCLRKSEGKTFGYVIVPYIFDPLLKREDFLKTEYRDVLTTIRKLALYDKTFHEEIKLLKNNKKYFSKKVQIEVTNNDKILEVEKLNTEIKITNFANTGPLNWLPFDEAKLYVKRLAIKSANDYRKRFKNNELDSDLPAAPDDVYREEGFTSWGDFLGTDTIASLKIKENFVDYNEFVLIVRSLNLKYGKDYFKIPLDKKRELRIPAGPVNTYPDEFTSWGEILNTGYKATFNRQFKSLEEAKKFLIPLNIPSETVYKFWISKGKSIERSLSSLYIKNIKKFIKDNLPEPPSDLPIELRGHYGKKGKIKINISEVFGFKKNSASNLITSDRWWNFEKARKFVIKLELWKQEESKKVAGVGIVNKWRAYCKNIYRDLPAKPLKIPNEPVNTYTKEWISWANWIGTEYWDYETLKKFIKKLKLYNYKLPKKYYTNDKGGKSLIKHYGYYKSLFHAYVNNAFKELEVSPPQVPRIPQRQYKDIRPFQFKDLII